MVIWKQQNHDEAPPPLWFIEKKITQKKCLENGFPIKL